VAQEHSVFTWDPVGARWIHERGPEMTTPPVPPDVHAIQTYFFDLDSKEWIATVLAPRGRSRTSCTRPAITSSTCTGCNFIEPSSGSVSTGAAASMLNRRALVPACP